MGLCGGCRQALVRSKGALPWARQAPAVEAGEGDDDCSQLVDARAAARLLGLAPASVRRMGRDGRLRSILLPGPSGDPHGARRRFKLGDLRRLLAGHALPSEITKSA